MMYGFFFFFFLFSFVFIHTNFKEKNISLNDLNIFCSAAAVCSPPNKAKREMYNKLET